MRKPCESREPVRVVKSQEEAALMYAAKPARHRPRRSRRPPELTWPGVALDEGVAGKVAGANAHRGVTDGPALGIPAARARARVPALLIDASLLAGTFAVAHALRPTPGRSSDKLRQTRAGRGAVDDLALRVRAAGRRLAGVGRRRRRFFRWN